jgi:micrococcal nuclease
VRRAVVLLLLAGCGDDGSSCGPASAHVDRVIDGDTIVLDDGSKVRYLLINAPETTNGHNDCYGANAATFNSDLVLDKTVNLSYDVQCKDMFGRWLAYVSVDGTEVNSLMLQRGYACLLHISPDGDSRLAEFKGYQDEAKAAGRGLWSACNPIPCN